MTTLAILAICISVCTIFALLLTLLMFYVVGLVALRVDALERDSVKTN